MSCMNAVAVFGQPPKPDKSAGEAKVSSNKPRHHPQKGIKVSDEQPEAVGIKKHDFHGDWNYTFNK